MSNPGSRRPSAFERRSSGKAIDRRLSNPSRSVVNYASKEILVLMSSQAWVDRPLEAGPDGQVPVPDVHDPSSDIRRF
jgi:hypothetical protein